MGELSILAEIMREFGVVIAFVVLIAPAAVTGGMVWLRMVARVKASAADIEAKQAEMDAEQARRIEEASRAIIDLMDKRDAERVGQIVALRDEKDRLADQMTRMRATISQLETKLLATERLAENERRRAEDLAVKVELLQKRADELAATNDRLRVDLEAAKVVTGKLAAEKEDLMNQNARLANDNAHLIQRLQEQIAKIEKEMEGAKAQIKTDNRDSGGSAAGAGGAGDGSGNGNGGE